MRSSWFIPTYRAFVRVVERQCRCLMLFMLLVGLGPQALAQQAGVLQVTGTLVKDRSFSVSDIAALPQKEITETRSIGSGQQQTSTPVKYGGALLRDVLAAADFREKERRDFRRTLVVARARDGYVALFTWGELYNTKMGDSILVITSKDGKPLPDSEGPYALRALGDIKPGPRHVKWLEQIQVETVKP